MASFLLSLFSALFLATTITESEAYSTTVKAQFPGYKPEKLTHLHFYFHDIVSGNNPTSVLVATGPTTNSYATGFGMVAVVDDLLTMGPEVTSEEVGRAQGLYASAGQNSIGLLMNFNCVFTKGKFADSIVAMFGQNPILENPREMPIIEGTGAFRFGTGYAQPKTFTFNHTSGDAVVEYNVFN